MVLILLLCSRGIRVYACICLSSSSHFCLADFSSANLGLSKADQQPTSPLYRDSPISPNAEYTRKLLNEPTPSMTGNTTLPIIVGGLNIVQNFTYSDDLTPSITHVSPDSASTSVTNVFTIYGSGFLMTDLNTTLESHRVTFEDRVCEISDVSDTNIVCILPRGEVFPTSLISPTGMSCRVV